jgi:YegS/Rv2252/BmrU family lipid kinase
MYHIIVNENSLNKRNQKKLNQVKEVFERAERKYKIHYTTHQGHATEIAKELSSENEQNTLVVMGGDGTLHDVLNGIVNFSTTSMGLIPMGTGNDFAAAAHIPSDAKKAAELIAFLPPQTVDYIELSNGLRTLNAIGMGIDVDVLKVAYSGTNTKKSKYLHALFYSLRHFKSYDFTVCYNGKEENHFGLLAGLGNGRQIGGGIKVFPDAKINDEYMDLVIVDYLSKFRTIKAFIKLMLGRMNKIHEVTAIKVKEAKFIHHGSSYTVQADGELYDDLPFEAKIIESGLKFYLPVNND